MKTEFLHIIPVLPSADIARDLAWYKEKLGFQERFSDPMYAGMVRENIYIHLQWHAGTESDPLIGGSVARIVVKNIRPYFEELIRRGTVNAGAFSANTPWGTNEFNVMDLNRNAIFIMEEAE
jgi:hypothetical protein